MTFYDPRHRFLDIHRYTITTQEWPEPGYNPYVDPDPHAPLIWCGDRDAEGRQVLIEHPWYEWERENPPPHPHLGTVLHIP